MSFRGIRSSPQVSLHNRGVLPRRRATSPRARAAHHEPVCRQRSRRTPSADLSDRLDRRGGCVGSCAHLHTHLGCGHRAPIPAALDERSLFPQHFVKPARPRALGRPAGSWRQNRKIPRPRAGNGLASTARQTVLLSPAVVLLSRPDRTPKHWFPRSSGRAEAPRGGAARRREVEPKVRGTKKRRKR